MSTPVKGTAYRAFEIVLRPLVAISTSRTWTGTEHIPAEGGVLVVSNHVSHLDPVVLAHYLNNAGRAVRFLAKASLFDVRVIGPMLRSAGQIPVHRQQRNAADSLDSACAAIERGECVVVMPEGTITRDPDLWPMIGKTGAARIALRTGCPVIPVGQAGPETLLPPYRRIPRLLPRKRMRISAGPAVNLDRWREQSLTPAVARAATVEIMRRITELVSMLRGRPAPAEPFDPARSGVPEIGNPYRRSA